MINLRSRRAASRLRAFLVVAAAIVFSAASAGQDPVAAQRATETIAQTELDNSGESGAENQAAAAAAHEIEGRYVKEGLVVDFSVRPLESAQVQEGLMTDIRFTITEEASGDPVTGLAPGAWMDIGRVIEGQSGTEVRECKDKIALYLRGVVGIRPMVDLNSYYVLVMNQDPSITVVDPLISMAGRTSTLSVIVLGGNPMDWTKSKDGKWLYVSMPAKDQVAVIDTDSFVVRYNVEAGDSPTRVAVQPDGRYLWIGNDSRRLTSSGVMVLDTSNLKRMAEIQTGAGHHEIAFSEDDRYALVTNRGSGTATVIDVATLEKVKDLELGGQPIGVAYSTLAQAFYVSDGEGGVISVIDAGSLEVTKRIEAKPGLGPTRASQDGRWVMTVNTLEGLVHVVDTASGTLIHSLEVGKQPFQVNFTRSFAYVRSLDTERVHMINLSSLGEGKKPIVQTFATGSVPPKMAPDLVIADTISPAEDEAAVFVVNPADNTTYFYMEGMNAPMGNYRTYGHHARAVKVVDRSLKEVQPGVYAGKVRIPAAGRYDVAFMLDSPQLLHCFSVSAEKNPMMYPDPAYAYLLDYLEKPAVVEAGDTLNLRFRLVDQVTGQPKTGVEDVIVRHFRAPASPPAQSFAREVVEGVYEVSLPMPVPGAYYLHVGSRSLKLEFGDLPFATVRVVKPSEDAGVGQLTVETRG